MRTGTAGELLELLHAALDGRISTQVWLGYADVLFMGFGSEVLPPPKVNAQGRREHAMPRYELRTEFSSWRVGSESSSEGGNAFDSEQAEALVGSPVSSWRILKPSWGLEIVFAEDRRLEVIPYPGAVDERRELWSVRDPKGSYTVMTALGEVLVRSGDEPIHG